MNERLSPLFLCGEEVALEAGAHRWGGLGYTVDTLLTICQDPANGLELLFLFTFSLLSWGCLPGTAQAITVVFLAPVLVSFWKISRSTKIVFVLKGFR